MKIPTYNQAKGRAISHKITNIAGSIRKRSNRKRGKGTRIYKKAMRDSGMKSLPEIVGKIPKGYVLENALVLSFPPIAYVAVCDSYETKGDDSGHRPFIRIYTRCKESSSEFCSLSKEVKDKRDAMMQAVKGYSIGGHEIGQSTWEEIYTAASDAMREYTTKGNERVSQVAVLAMSKAASVHASHLKALSKRQAKEES